MVPDGSARVEPVGQHFIGSPFMSWSLACRKMIEHGNYMGEQKWKMAHFFFTKHLPMQTGDSLPSVGREQAPGWRCYACEEPICVHCNQSKPSMSSLSDRPWKSREVARASWIPYLWDSSICVHVIQNERAPPFCGFVFAFSPPEPLDVDGFCWAYVCGCSAMNSGPSPAFCTSIEAARIPETVGIRLNEHRSSTGRSLEAFTTPGKTMASQTGDCPSTSTLEGCSAALTHLSGF